MAGSRKLPVAFIGLGLSLAMILNATEVAEAGSSNYLGEFSGGVSAILDAGATNTAEVLMTTARELNIDLNVPSEDDKSTLVMANVSSALNVREEPDAESAKAGMLYKDCGGTILERKDGWTKIQSGNLVGWANDEFLLFGEEAEALASEVGITLARTEDGLNVRKEPSTEADIHGILPKGEEVEVLSVDEDGWACIDYDGKDGYVSMDFVSIEFKLDAGETMDEIKARKDAEEEAKRHVNYGEYTTDVDTTLLLAALIHCEARGESYEGQVAVGAVVMNRVRSAAYPDTIHGVIYASGQFSPAQSGKLNQVLESGKISPSCMEAAKEALSGVSNVGDRTHFRRNNGTREGLVIGNHVFY